MKHVVFVLLFSATSLVSLAQSETEAKRLADARAYYAKSDFVYPYVDSAPAYPGGIDKWNSYVGSTSVFTDAVAKAKSQNMPAGVYTVMLRFAINADGTVGDVKTMGKPYGYGLEEAAIKLVKESGKWTPANIEGEAAKGYMQLPIRFSIIR
jgi:protein TonB